MGSKVLKRSVALDALRQWAGKIADLAEDITDIRDEENLERELRYSDSMTSKTENMDKYAANIFNRPPKEWIMTKTEKRQLGEDMADHAKKAKTDGIKEREQDAKRISRIGKRSKKAEAPRKGKNVVRHEEAHNQKKKRMRGAANSRKGTSGKEQKLQKVGR